MVAKVIPITRQTVLIRSLGKCERCYGSLTGPHGLSVHHRKPRGMGGSVEKHINEPANLIVLCGSGVSGCHGWVESNRNEAREKGFLVYRNDNPENIPFKCNENIWWFINNKGDKTPNYGLESDDDPTAG